MGKTNIQLRSSSDFMNEPCKSERDAFYLEKIQTKSSSGKPIINSMFKIYITKEYFEKHRTLFPNNHFPNLFLQLLPDPLKEDSKPRACRNKEPAPTYNYFNRQAESNATFHWSSADQRSEIIFDSTCERITEIWIWQKPGDS